jgi:hypothetical protein
MDNVYSLISLWKDVLVVSEFGNCEYSCYKHLYAGFCAHIVLTSLGKPKE